MAIHNYKLGVLGSETEHRKYKAYTLQNFRELPQMELLSEEAKFAMEVVGNVFPFKTNSYVVDELIDWDNVPADPIFTLTFPQREMLKPAHFDTMAAAIVSGASTDEIRKRADSIRAELNPHPAGQMECNVPELNGERLNGLQHKYGETVLFFPVRGQTCHAYCSFCFRWPQFVGVDELRFAMRETEQLAEYIRLHPEVTDVLITGGDPMVMKAKRLAGYVDALLNSDLKNLSTIRIGTKALSFWPYRFTTDNDSKELLSLFKKIVDSGKHLAIMAHFSHPRELQTEAAKEAIAKILETGAQIRTQSPLLSHINDSSEVWAQMWQEQVSLGCIPYYMFVARNTGAHHYFGVPLVKAHAIYKEAISSVSGVARTARGPVMSSNPGKIQVLGTNNEGPEKLLALQFLQARNPNWINNPFFAAYDDKALWIDELKPAFGADEFFFQKEQD
ncbi:MAG: lysine 2,3-aminomutase [Proteobacteria bacterium]|nr:lysine 2,3-aminomutase [Pseudomonadota bacterium]